MNGTVAPSAISFKTAATPARGSPSSATSRGNGSNPGLVGALCFGAVLIRNGITSRAALVERVDVEGERSGAAGSDRDDDLALGAAGLELSMRVADALE